MGILQGIQGNGKMPQKRINTDNPILAVSENQTLKKVSRDALVNETFFVNINGKVVEVTPTIIGLHGGISNVLDVGATVLVSSDGVITTVTPGIVGSDIIVDRARAIRNSYAAASSGYIGHTTSGSSYTPTGAIHSSNIGDGRRGLKVVFPTRGVITSAYGEDRGSYTHTGVDIGARTGEDIKAADNGVVSVVSYGNLNGNYIVISHDDGNKSYYLHCSRILKSKGDRVNKGDVIAKVGSTGHSTGPHLHFEVHDKNNKVISPNGYLVYE